MHFIISSYARCFVQMSHLKLDTEEEWNGRWLNVDDNEWRMKMNETRQWRRRSHLRAQRVSDEIHPAPTKTADLKWAAPSSTELTSVLLSYIVLCRTLPIITEIRRAPSSPTKLRQAPSRSTEIWHAPLRSNELCWAPLSSGKLRWASPSYNKLSLAPPSFDKVYRAPSRYV